MYVFVKVVRNFIFWAAKFLGMYSPNLLPTFMSSITNKGAMQSFAMIGQAASNFQDMAAKKTD